MVILQTICYRTFNPCYSPGVTGIRVFIVIVTSSLSFRLVANSISPAIGVLKLAKFVIFNVFLNSRSQNFAPIIGSLSRRSPSHPPVLSLVLPTHLHSIPCTLSSFPKSRPSLSYQPRMTDPAIFWAIILLSGAESTNHAIRMLVWMFLCLVMAAVTRIHLRATGESEPAVGLRIMLTAASFR